MHTGCPVLSGVIYFRSTTADSGKTKAMTMSQYLLMRKNSGDRFFKHFEIRNNELGVILLLYYRYYLFRRTKSGPLQDTKISNFYSISIRIKILTNSFKN